MQNFNFYNPTRICFGQGSIAQLDKLVPADARVLVLYGGQSAKKNGTLDEVAQALGTRDVSYFAGIEPNPSYETLCKAITQVKAEQRNFLLAVGGGSVIDGTKFVAAGALFEGDPWQIMLAGGRNIQQALPLASVLTLPATGSEMNRGGVITQKSTHSKLSFKNDLLYPTFSILDPTKTYSLPAKQVSNGVVDAFVHVMEQYLTYPVDAKVQDRFAEGLLLTLVEEGEKAVAQTDNYDCRANLMWTATLALNGLIGSGVPQDWSTHMLGHELTALYGLDHGQTLAVILPAMLEQMREAKHAKLLQYAQRIWGITQGSEAQRIDQAIAQTRAFFEKVGIKTYLKDYGLNEEIIPTVIAQLKAHNMLTLGEHGSVTPEVCAKVLKLAL